MNSTKSFLARAGIVTLTVATLCAPMLANAATLTRELQFGMSGSDVSTLQTFLAQDVTIYPQGLVTGYFGMLTKSAVSNFQARNGIANVGRVGPATLPVINAQIASGMNVNAGKSAQISPVSVSASRNSVSVNWSTDEDARGVVYYSSSPLVTYERTNSVDVSGQTAMTDNNLHMSQSVMIQNLQASTVYYYMVYTTDQSGNVSVTAPQAFQTTN
jgi:peptidoglycan hydrolase-like protein with peptidoglycan-binding domain